MPDVNGLIVLLPPADLSSVFNGHAIDSVLKSFGDSNPSRFDIDPEASGKEYDVDYQISINLQF